MHIPLAGTTERKWPGQATIAAQTMQDDRENSLAIEKI
jgi:hypothetical protein